MNRLLVPLCLLALAGCEKSKTKPTKPVEEKETAGAEEAKIEIVKVTDRISMLVGRGGNVAVAVADEGVLLVDDKFEDLADPIRKAVATLSDGKLVYVLNTHHHGDHTGGNVVFGKEATLVSHENVRKKLAAGEAAREALPVITFTEAMSIHWGGEEVRLVHLPNGHTDGDSAIYFTKSGVVHLGDNFFNGKLPFVDLDHGGDPSVLLSSTENLLETLAPDVKLIPGHGPLATKSDLEKFRDMLADTIGTIKAAKAKGATLEQVKKKAFGGKYKDWATSFVPEERWAEIIYKSLK